MSKMGAYAYNLAEAVQQKHPDWTWEQCMNYITRSDQNEETEKELCIRGRFFQSKE